MKYRIVQKRLNFYPQYKRKRFWWNFSAAWTPAISIEEAMEVINRDKIYQKSPKKLVHDVQ